MYQPIGGGESAQSCSTGMKGDKGDKGEAGLAGIKGGLSTLILLHFLHKYITLGCIENMHCKYEQALPFQQCEYFTLLLLARLNLSAQKTTWAYFRCLFLSPQYSQHSGYVT